VAVLERAPHEKRGGQSRYSEAYLRMKSHSEVSDDFEEHLAENGSGYVDPDLIAETARPLRERAAYATALSVTEPNFITTFAEEAGPTISWLEGIGLRFGFLPTQFLTKSQSRLLPVGGGLALVEWLAARAESLGVTFFYETTGTGRERDEDGQVMRALPINDATMHGGSIPPNGRVLQDVLLVRVKAPGQSRQSWDYYDVLSTIAGNDVFMSEAESGCKLPRTLAPNSRLEMMASPRRLCARQHERPANG